LLWANDKLPCGKGGKHGMVWKASTVDDHSRPKHSLSALTLCAFSKKEGEGGLITCAKGDLK